MISLKIANYTISVEIILTSFVFIYTDNTDNVYLLIRNL